MELSEFYQDYDTLMPRICPSYEKNLSLLVGFLPLSGKVLELGSGTGNLAARIVQERPGLELWGVELQKSLLELAKKKVPGVNFMLADLRDLDLKGFEGVVSALTLHHLKKEEKYDVYRKIIASSSYFINYDRMLLSPEEEPAIKEMHLEFMKGNKIPKRFVDMARKEMEEKDSPLTLEEELFLFREASWKVGLVAFKDAFAVYKVSRP